MQKIDIGLLDSSYNITVAKGLVLSEKSEINYFTLDLPRDLIGVILNINDYGYCKIRYDKTTLKALTANLHRIQDPLTRAQILRNLWNEVIDMNFSSLAYFDMAVSQLQHETVDQILALMLDHLSTLIFNYIPVNLIEQKSKQVYTAILNIFKNESLDEDLMIPLVDNLFDFLSDFQHIQQAIQWLKKGFIYVDDDNNELFELCE